MFFIFIGIVFYLIIFFPTFQIKALEISGNQKVKDEEIKNIVEKEIQKKILFFPSRSVFLTNSEKIKKSVLTAFPAIGKIELKRRLFRPVLEITIYERIPVGVWCKNDNCFSIDNNGIIFEETSLNGKLVVEKTGQEEPVSLGQSVLEESLMSMILEIQEKLRGELKIEIKVVNIPHRERLNVKTAEGWEIYFDPKGDISEEISNLILVLEEQISPEKRKYLEYIDLRFGNRVYFK